MWKNTIYLELKKAMKNKIFIVSVIAGCLITILSLVFNLQIFFDKNTGFNRKIVYDGWTANPCTPMFTVYNHWIGGEVFSLGTSIYFFVFPLLVAMPYGWSMAGEYKSGYAKIMISKMGRNKYYVSKYIATFVSGGLAMTIPLVFNFATSLLFFPAIKPVVIYDSAYGVFKDAFLSELYYTFPVLYVALYVFIDFCFGGVIACISMLAARFVKYKWITVVIPFLVILAIHFSTRYIYVSPTVRYRQVSPLYFLRPVTTAYPASGWIIFAMFFVLLIVTVLIGIMPGRKNEIYS